MSARRRDALLLAVLTAFSYALAFLQRPGLAVTDTKIDLHVDPLRFLSDAAAPWTQDISLGHVQSGQYGGYVFPMGPFFAVFRELGASAWVTERLWLGTVFALAAWGVVLLLDAMKGRPRGVTHLVAAGIFVLNPYVITYVSRVSVSLLGYAALPFLLLAVHRGLRATGGGRLTRWLWPAVFAVIVTSSGGGINAAVTAWVLVGPLMLLVYEPLWGGVTWRDVWSFVWRTALIGLFTSLWWVVPLLVQSKWGLPFLPYTEQAGTIWGSTSASESLRLMGFWLSYVGTGYGGTLRPYMVDAHVLLFWVPAVLASVLVPGLALGGFAWTRRWRYAPFFLAMLLVGVVVMIVGFPEGTPLRKGVTFAYNHLVSLQFLRTTYKAGPLVALGVAVLGGAAAQVAWTRLRAVTAPAVRRTALVGVAGVLVALLAFSAWPLIRGHGVDDHLTWKSIPTAWRDVAHDLDRDLGDQQRAMVLPGQLFSSYRWGDTVDPILPTLARKPVAVRQVVPFADLRSTGLQWGTDALISQQRLLPGQLRQLLALQSVGQVVSGTDDDRAASGALGADEADGELARGGLTRPTQTYGPATSIPAEAGDVAPARTLNQVRRYATPGAAPMVRLLPRDRATIVDGAGDGIVALSAFAKLPTGQPLRYAADLTPTELRALARTGSPVVITDTNRRQVFIPSRLRGNYGATLAPGDPISADGHQLDPWPDSGTGVQTVAQIHGARYVRAPFSPQVTQFPEHRPFAAVDGDPSTAWLADRALQADQWHLDVGLLRPRDVPYVDLLPYSDARGVVKKVAVNGIPFAVHPGWNHLKVDLHDVDQITVTMVDVQGPAKQSRGAGGIRELRIPGVHITETLRVPTDAQAALAGTDLTNTPLTYLFSRTRGDDPFHRAGVHGPWQAGYVRDQGDGETGLRRTIAPPAARSWTPAAWLTVNPATPDHTLDGWIGGRYPARYDSSGRFENQGRYRASSAFDGRRASAWISGWLGPDSRAQLRWTAPRTRTVRVLHLVAPTQRVRVPTKVRLTVDGHASGALTVAGNGDVALPGPVRGRAFALTVLDARFPPHTGGQRRQRRAVGIAEVQGTGLVSAVPRTAGPVRTACVVALRSVPGAGAAPATAADPGFRLAAHTTVAAMNGGGPLAARSCGDPTALPAGEQTLVAPADQPLRIDALSLTSPAPTPAATVESAGTVVQAGRAGRGSRTDIRLDVRRPAWLVFGQSYTTGWRASCDGHSLGAPVPIEGYAVGWPVDPGCRVASIVFAGNAPVAITFWISLVATLLALALVAAGLWRRRGTVETPLPDLPDTDPPARLSLRRALAFGVAAALLGGFVFAVRAGVVIGPVVALVLWRGIGARWLSLAAGVLLVVVSPILTLVVPVHNHGGYDSNLPVERISAHWVTVGAILLLVLALYRVLADRRSRRVERTPRKSTPNAATH
jgi:hypothetical protein